MATFKTLMKTLDCYLTGKSFHIDCEHTFKNTQVKTPEDFLNRKIYYLSDGGYSRIAYSELEGKLFLTSESLPKVIENWGRCKELIADIENQILSHSITNLI